MKPKREIIPADPQEIARATALVADARVERMRGLQDLAASIHRQTQEILEIYLYNRNQGVQIQEIPDDAGGASMDYKLKQMADAVNALRDIIDPEREVERKAKWLEEQRKLR